MRLKKAGSIGLVSLAMLVIGMQRASWGDATDVVTNAPPEVAPAMAPPAPNSPPLSATNTDSPAPSQTPPTFEKAKALYGQGKQDEALDTLNAVLQAEPKNGNAYILRGAIYASKQVWDQAEKDFEAALQIDPKNCTIQYDLADLEFKQKKFDDARSSLVAMQDVNDKQLNDLVKYKIFLCDLGGGHEEVARKELDVFNQAGSNPSYYFANIAWSVDHKKTEEAKDWLASATRIYSPHKQLYYALSLKEMGYLPLPQ
jgi:tetratricopeptide (TPR) repeat protein